MNYKKRIADNILKEKLESFGGVLIVGPKGFKTAYLIL